MFDDCNRIYRRIIESIQGNSKESLSFASRCLSSVYLSLLSSNSADASEIILQLAREMNPKQESRKLQCILKLFSNILTNVPLDYLPKLSEVCFSVISEIFRDFLIWEVEVRLCAVELIQCLVRILELNPQIKIKYSTNLIITFIYQASADFSVDSQRGDIGSWIREKALEVILDLINYNSFHSYLLIQNQPTWNNHINLILSRSLFENITKLRFLASRGFSEIDASFSSYFTESSSAYINNEELVGKLVASSDLSVATVLGLSRSLNNAVPDNLPNTLFSTLETLENNETRNQIMTSLLHSVVSLLRDDYLAKFPSTINGILKFAAILLEMPLEFYQIQLNSNIAQSISEILLDFCKKNPDISRYLVCIKLFGILIRLSNCSQIPCKVLLKLLQCKYPIIRLAAAESLFESCLLTNQENISDFLLKVPW